jgi:predicted nucleic acid-binding protein
MMLCYLDTCIVIYAVEGQAPFQQRARNHLAALEAAGYGFVVSDLTRNECLIKPLGAGDGPLLLQYSKFFIGPNLGTIGLTLVMHERASLIRESYSYASGKRYSLPDALHLAAAVEFGCASFLTNDNDLAGFPEITVDVLP